MELLMNIFPVCYCASEECICLYNSLLMFKQRLATKIIGYLVKTFVWMFLDYHIPAHLFSSNNLVTTFSVALTSQFIAYLLEQLTLTWKIRAGGSTKLCDETCNYVITKVIGNKKWTYGRKYETGHPLDREQMAFAIR